MEVGYLGYSFILFLAEWSQMEMKPSEPPDAKVLCLHQEDWVSHPTEICIDVLSRGCRAHMGW